MCIIIVKQKTNTIPQDVLKNSAQINPHGLGIVWLDTFEVSYHKSKEYNLLKTNRPFIAHFRFATKGKINKENTHPFVCGKNKNELLMMNGTISELGNAKISDSKELANILGNTPRFLWKKELARHYHCRFVTINKLSRSFQIYNRHLYTLKDGVWYSKENVLKNNFVAVYGTLKTGGSNYYSYLRDSDFVASGKTSQKYPLIIDGLPYLLQDKGKGYHVKVDVFKVSDQTLSRLDGLEGHPHFYERVKIPIVCDQETITCWVYFSRTKDLGSNTMHDSYPHSPYLPQNTFSFDTQSEEDCVIEDDFDPTNESPVCPTCYKDVAKTYCEYGNLYYCEDCLEWVTTNNYELKN